jgi:hypothetical protein
MIANAYFYDNNLVDARASFESAKRVCEQCLTASQLTATQAQDLREFIDDFSSKISDIDKILAETAGRSSVHARMPMEVTAMTESKFDAPSTPGSVTNLGVVGRKNKRINLTPDEKDVKRAK